MFITTFTYAGAVPLVVAAVIAFGIRQIGGSAGAAWAWGVALAFVAAQLGLKSEAGWRNAAGALAAPNEAVDWLSIIILLALGISLLLMAAAPTHRPYARVLMVAFSIAAVS